MTNDDAASLIKVVDQAQSSTRVRLRARLPEMSMIVAAGSLAGAVGHWSNRRDAAEYLVGTVVLCLIAWHDARRRSHLGGHIDRIGWIATAIVLVAAIAANLVTHGDAKDAATGICFGAGLLIFAFADRSPVLAVPVAVIVVAEFAGHSTAASVLAFAAGLLCVFVVKAAQRGRKSSTS